MRRIIFDIETCAYPVESLSESQQEYLLRYSEKETEEDKKSQKRDDAIRYLQLQYITWKRKRLSSIMKVMFLKNG